MEEFIFGTFVYEYQLVKQNRKTLSLTVMPNLAIILKCPECASSDKIENFLRRKWFWLEKQLSFFKKYRRKLYQKEYISGEGCLYLGRQYKLLVREGENDLVTLAHGKFIVYSTKSVSNGEHNKKIINDWFEKKTKKILQERLLEMLVRFDCEKAPKLFVRDMKRRWGSFVSKERILLNPKLIYTPKDCIDYVIVHELCHQQHKSHDAKFWKLLNEKYPKWEKVKDKLETIGAGLF